jgi:threonyl-tRNA synthetase
MTSSVIEERMRAVMAAADQPFERQVVSKDEARELFADDPLKLERLEELGDDEVITVYRNGPLPGPLRGAPRTRHGLVLKHFKLLSTAGAYWRGDERARCSSASTARRSSARRILRST